MNKAVRKKDGAPLSLFSFQDVITSITGIMILLVLMMILDLIQKQPGQETAPPTPDDTPERVSPDRVAALEAQLSALNRRLHEGQEALLALVSQSPRQIGRKIRLAEHQGAKLDEKLKENETAVSNLVRELKSQTEAAEKLEKEVAAAREKEEQLDGEFKRSEEIKGVTVKIPERLEKESVLVMCKPNQIEASVIGGGEPARTFRNARQFLDWARSSKNPQDHAFFILVNPAAAQHAAELVRWMRERDYVFGYQPLLNHEQVFVR